MAKFPTRRTAFRFSNATASPLGRITTLATGYEQTKSLDEWRTFGQYALVYVLNGMGSYADANGWEQDLRPGDLVFVFPRLAHFYNPAPGTRWQVSFVCFQGPVFDLWESHGVLDPRRPVHHLEPIDLWSRRIEDVAGASGYAPPLQQITRLQELLAAVLTGEGRAQVYQDDLRWAQQACSLIETKLEQSPDWPRLARQFGLSPEGFRKRFTRLTGQPPARYHMGRRIDRACELMQQGRWSDRQIADQLGFCDEFYFSRRFKEITGRSPRAFRRSLWARAGGDL